MPPIDPRKPRRPATPATTTNRRRTGTGRLGTESVIDLDTDPAADEIREIRRRASELAAMADQWLRSRETYRAAAAEQAEYREHRAATHLSGGTHRS